MSATANICDIVLLFHYFYVRPRTDKGFGAGLCFLKGWLRPAGVAIFRADSLGLHYE